MFNNGDVVFGVIPQPNSVMVIQVRLLDFLEGTWSATELGRISVKGNKVRRVTWDIREKDLFNSESDAIAEARKRRPTGGGGGDKH